MADPKRSVTAFFEATRDRFRTHLKLHDARHDADPYRSLGGDGSLVGVWVGAMDTAMTWNWSGLHGLCIEVRDGAAIVEADRGTETGDVRVRGDRIEIVCQNISLSGVRRGDEIAGSWGVVTNAKSAAGEFYLVRKESLPTSKANVLRAKALRSTKPHAAITVFVLLFLTALDSFAQGRWGIHLGILLGCLIVAPSACHQFAMGRRGRAWGRALNGEELPIRVRAPSAKERQPSAFEHETRTDASSEGNPDAGEFDPD